eukprot:g83288.t1
MLGLMSGDDPSGGPLPVQPYAADIEELHIMRQRKSEEEHMSQRESEEVHRNQRECEEGHMRPSGPRQGAQGKAEEKEEHLRPSGPWQGGEGNAEGKEEKKEDKSQRGPSQGVEGKAEQEEEEHNGQREQPEGVEEPALRGLDDEDETDSDQHLEDIKEDKDKEGKQQHLEKAEGGIPELNRAETFEEIHQATVRQRRNIWQETKQVASEFWQGPEQEWGKENVDAFWAYTFWCVYEAWA